MFEGGGNVPLITPVVAAMVERGHDVAVVAGPNIRRPEPGLPSDGFCDRIRGAGAHVLPLLDTPIDPLADYTAPAAISDAPPTTWPVRSTPGASRGGRDRVNWPLPGLPLPPPGSLPMRGPAGWSRDKAWAVTYNRVARREGQRFVNEARTLLGLHPLRRLHEQVERADRVLVMSSRAFELPLRGPLPENVRHVGAILTARPETSWRPPEDDGRPLVLVSLSTLPQGQGPVMRRVLEAMSTLPVRAVVTLGPALAKETFDIPANVHVEAFVPHELVLPHVSAVVTQCGLSTITKVLAAGLPIVGLPVLGDQPANAARIVAAGAGLRLPKEASATTIGEAVRRILDDSRFRRSAGRFAAVLANQNPADLIVTELENLLGRTTMTLE
jgi:UDP:flavonoid glycosyltransferase YjiC (YdhE family)